VHQFEEEENRFLSPLDKWIHTLLSFCGILCLRVLLPCYFPFELLPPPPPILDSLFIGLQEKYTKKSQKKEIDKIN